MSPEELQSSTQSPTIEKERVMDIGEAHACIEGIRSQTHSMGGNDQEPALLDRIVVEMKRGLITPGQAVERAEAILKHKYGN